MRDRESKRQEDRRPDREIIAKAEGRLARADKQRAAIKTDPHGAVLREKQRFKPADKAGGSEDR